MAPRIAQFQPIGPDQGQLSPYQSITAPRNNAGAALAEAGAQIQRGVAAFGDTLLRAKALETENLARDSNLAYAESQIPKYTEYASISGREAVLGLPAYLASRKEDYDAALAALPSDRARDLARPGMDARYLNLVSAAHAHSAEQNKAWSVGSSTSAAALHGQDAILHRNSFDEIQVDLANGVQEIINAAEVNGLDEASQSVLAATFLGDQWKSII